MGSRAHTRPGRGPKLELVGYTKKDDAKAHDSSSYRLRFYGKDEGNKGSRPHEGDISSERSRIFGTAGTAAQLPPGMIAVLTMWIRNRG